MRCFVKAVMWSDRFLQSIFSTSRHYTDGAEMFTVPSTFAQRSKTHTLFQSISSAWFQLFRIAVLVETFGLTLQEYKTD